MTRTYRVEKIRVGLFQDIPPLHLEALLPAHTKLLEQRPLVERLALAVALVRNIWSLVLVVAAPVQVFCGRILASASPMSQSTALSMMSMFWRARAWGK